jgi:hypothetical protein
MNCPNPSLTHITHVTTITLNGISSMISQAMPQQGANPAFYQPSRNITPQNPFPETPDSVKLSPKEKAIAQAGRNQAALNYLNFQILIGKRLQQLAQAPLTVATLPMGELRQLSEAIGPNEGHRPHHPPFPPPFGFPPPPPPPPDFSSSSALQTGSEGPQKPAEAPPTNDQNRMNMLA